MNNLEKEEILSKEILSVIDKIIEIVPEAIFGGSIALNALGLIHRKINDIDLLFGLHASLTRNGIIYLNPNLKDEELFSSSVEDENNQIIQRTSLKVDDVRICCFKVELKNLRHTEISFLRRTIKIQNIDSILAIKRKYAAKGIEKHIKDLEEIEKNLK